MKKNLGILCLLVVICLITAWMSPAFLKPYNIENVTRWTCLYSIISIGVAFVIISGGIDLSIGSVIGLVGCLIPMLMVKRGWTAPEALSLVMLVALSIGLLHGLLITRLKLQPFVVTLCGLLIYRGLARWITEDRTMGWGGGFDELRFLATGSVVGVPVPLLIVIALALVAGVFLNLTVWGRYLLALGRNEQAARFSGINTKHMTILAYVICSGMGGIAGILFALYVPAVQPASHGNFYELYAIAAAVLGGCSLRGGEGSIFGVLIGTAVMRVLYNSINLMGIPTQLEFAIVGGVILVGVIADEVVKRIIVSRQTAEGEAQSRSSEP